MTVTDKQVDAFITKFHKCAASQFGKGYRSDVKEALAAAIEVEKYSSLDYNLTDYQQDQQWYKELEDMFNGQVLFDDSYRAIAVIRGFFRLYFESRDNGTS